MNIYEIKRNVTNAPEFFTRKTMKFFNQTLKDFSVRKVGENRYELTAPMRDNNGKIIGYTKRVYNNLTFTFE